MFNLSDRVRHKITGDAGIVIGYGNQLVENKYLTTIKVRSIGSTFAEEVLEIWESHRPSTRVISIAFSISHAPWII
jgi:hypothetical protein